MKCEECRIEHIMLWSEWSGRYDIKTVSTVDTVTKENKNQKLCTTDELHIKNLNLLRNTTHITF